MRHKIEPQRRGIPHTKPTQMSVTPSTLSSHSADVVAALAQLPGPDGAARGDKKDIQLPNPR